MSKPLDLADKYEPLSYTDEYTPGAPDSTPTVRVHMPNFLPKVIIDDDGDDEVTIPDMKSPIHEEKRYPGIGLAIVFLSGGLFWGYVLWLIFGR